MKNMLTYQVENPQLEQRILKKARSIGQTVQQFITDSLLERLEKSNENDFDIPRMDIREHSYVYKPSISEEEQKEMVQYPDIKPFSDIKDTEQFARELRTKAWKK
jgi:hypothetical protein